MSVRARAQETGRPVVTLNASPFRAALHLRQFMAGKPAFDQRIGVLDLLGELRRSHDVSFSGPARAVTIGRLVDHVTGEVEDLLANR